MGILDNIGDSVSKISDKVDDAIEQGGDFIDSKTGNKYEDQIDKGQEALHNAVDALEKLGDNDAK